MLKYLYEELNNRRFKDLDITKIEDINNLYALIISRWCTFIAREGLCKEYVVIEDEELTSPKGQINVQQSIVLQTRSRGTLVCSYDELSADIFINHVLKAALQDVLFDGSIDEWIRVDTQKTMMLFNGVSYVDLTYVKWKDIKYNNSNVRYKHLIEVIKNVLFEKKMVKQGVLDENTRVYQLFKKQMFKWIKSHYETDDDRVELLEMPFTLDSEPAFEYKVNKNQKLVALRTIDRAVLICVRLETEQLIQDSKLARQHMEEMVTYIREYIKEHKVKTAGCILYVNTDKTKLNLKPMTVNVVNDYMIGVDTIDLHDQWRFIANKIHNCYKYFIERGKSNKSASQLADEDRERRIKAMKEANNMTTGGT